MELASYTTRAPHYGRIVFSLTSDKFVAMPHPATWERESSRLSTKPSPASVGGTMLTDPELIRQAEVLRITGLKRSTLYNLMKRQDDPFPPNYPTSQRGRAWIRSEVLDWCQRRKNVPKQPTPIELLTRAKLAAS